MVDFLCETEEERVDVGVDLRHRSTPLLANNQSIALAQRATFFSSHSQSSRLPQRHSAECRLHCADTGRIPKRRPIDPTGQNQRRRVRGGIGGEVCRLRLLLFSIDGWCRLMKRCYYLLYGWFLYPKKDYPHNDLQDAVGDCRLRHLPVPPPSEQDETYRRTASKCTVLVFHSDPFVHYVKMWRHPQNRKYITFCTVVGGGLSHGTCKVAFSLTRSHAAVVDGVSENAA